MTDARSEDIERSAVPKPQRCRRRQKIAFPPNVISLHQRIMPRHKALLAQWLDAGRRMGLCDASIFAPDRHSAGKPPSDYVLVWVRENIDPAYMICPDGVGWVVIDAIRQLQLVRTTGFAEALNMIRPVLEVGQAA